MSPRGNELRVIGIDLDSIKRYLENGNQQPDSVSLLAPGRLPLDYASLYRQIEYCSGQWALRRKVESQSYCLTGPKWLLAV